MGLPCMNCGVATPEHDAKVYLECFLCPVCKTVAERLVAQASSELALLRELQKNLIRQAILRHQLSLPPPPGPDEDGQIRHLKTVELLIGMMKEAPCREKESKS